MIDGRDRLRRLVLNALGYCGVAALARPVVGGIGAILMLHRVTNHLERPDGANCHLAITPGFLDQVIADMKARGYEFVTLDDALERLRRGQGGRPFATITADDGYRDNLTEALPVLERHGAPITIYIAPGLIDGAVDLWWDVLNEIVHAKDTLTLKTPSGQMTLDCSTPASRAEANARLLAYFTTEVREEEQRRVLHELSHSCGVDPDAPRRKTLMTWDEVRKAAGHPLVTIGAHTVHHYSLKRLDEAFARREIVEAGRILEAQLGQKPVHMAYPYGYPSAVGAREVALARVAGYASAVTTRHGVLHAGHAAHLQALPRISLNGRYQRLAYVLTMLSGISTPLANSGKLLVTV
jgi:peptidoglycan/xylan/chitin deacetylase (PgdA/CDA1 family)